MYQKLFKGYLKDKLSTPVVFPLFLFCDCDSIYRHPILAVKFDTVDIAQSWQRYCSSGSDPQMSQYYWKHSFECGNELPLIIRTWVTVIRLSNIFDAKLLILITFQYSILNWVALQQTKRGGEMQHWDPRLLFILIYTSGKNEDFFSLDQGPCLIFYVSALVCHVISFLSFENVPMALWIFFKCPEFTVAVTKL